MENSDSSVPSQQLSPVCVLQGMKVFFLVVVALYILYLIFLVVRACSELKNMPYSGISESRGCLSLAHPNPAVCVCVFAPLQICGSGF